MKRVVAGLRFWAIPTHVDLLSDEPLLRHNLRGPVAITCQAAVIVGIGALCWIASGATSSTKCLWNSRRSPGCQSPRHRVQFRIHPAPRGSRLWMVQGFGYTNYARTQPDSAHRMEQMGTNVRRRLFLVPRGAALPVAGRRWSRGAKQSAGRGARKSRDAACISAPRCKRGSAVCLGCVSAISRSAAGAGPISC